MLKIITTLSLLVSIGTVCIYDSPMAKENNLSLSGKLTFGEYRPILEESLGIVEVYLPGGQKKKLFEGNFAWRHPSGNIVINKGCGNFVNQLEVIDNHSRPTIASPCSSEINLPGDSKPLYELSRLSPDKQFIASEVKYNKNYFYDTAKISTVLINNGRIKRVFDGFHSPEWLPDGRLLLASDGIYITEIEGTPKKIDDGILSSGPNNLDVDPAGKRIAFEWNQRIWIMDIDGSNLKEIASGPATYRFPAWSPNGKHIAFVAFNSNSLSSIDRGIHFVEVDTGKYQYLDLSSSLGGAAGHVPYGPLSWTK